MEKSGILTDQILGAFGPKLKEIIITGPNLHTLTADAFEGMGSFLKLIDLSKFSLDDKQILAIFLLFNVKNKKRVLLKRKF